jgi:light-regulated signal transduction histidine kinase (bacteriophytochrome)
VLGLAWATERDFGEQVSFLETMASQIAAACQNALLHDKVQRHAAELEKRVAERTAQWQLANKELEAFAYSVSHDLRAPLRAIDGFSRLVLQDYGPQLPPEAQRDLLKVRSSAQRMGQLIDDLLAFSRLSRQPLDKRRVAPQDLVRQVLFDLQSDRKGRQVEVVIGELSTCQGDAALLRQVWINLLSNALKFTQGRAPARIEIGCIEKDGEQVYFVRDNGVGFDMRYAGKLFGVFQRLHRTEDYEGTGVGLAIVQRIIHRHGGRVWAEAAPGEGATFCFTLK